MNKYISSFVVVVMMYASSAFAAEKYLGTIFSATGADTTNETTASPFFIPFSAKITVQCTINTYINVSTLTAPTSTNALMIFASEKFPTSTESQNTSPTVTITSKKSTLVRISAAGADTCLVFQRLGTE
jgi:hypothetical protein